MDVTSLKDFIKIMDKKKIALSISLYLISAGFLLMCLIIYMLPFRIDVSFIDNIKWNANLNDNNFLINIAVVSCAIYLLEYIGRKVIVWICAEQGIVKMRNIYANIYTVNNIVELINSLLILLAVMTIFIQYYKTGILFLTGKSIVIYGVVLVKTGIFIVLHFRYKNLKIIDNVLNNSKNYSDENII